LYHSTLGWRTCIERHAEEDEGREMHKKIEKNAEDDEKTVGYSRLKGLLGSASREMRTKTRRGSVMHVGASSSPGTHP